MPREIFLCMFPRMETSPTPPHDTAGRVIAIDGPAGSGKSTTARMVAARLGYQYLDTGAMYRAVTWHALQNDIAPSEADTLAEFAESATIEFETHEDVNRVFLNGTDVTKEIRTPEVTKQVSEISAHKGVREAMVRKQQEIGRTGRIVAEGRDTTTVVFPNAFLKVYLDASVSTRARRRLKDLQSMGIPSSIEEQEADLKRRDHYDSTRKHSPLTRADGAVVVDTTDMSVEGQVDYIIDLVHQLAS